MTAVDSEASDPPADPFDADEPGQSGTDGAGRSRPLQALLLVAPLLVPFVVVLVALSRERWYPTGDLAQAELHVRGFPDHPPLVGAAGRIGVIGEPYGQGSHPGPSLWVALAPAYFLFGQTSLGIMVGMVSLHAAAIAGSVWVAAKIDGLRLAAVVAVLAAVLVRASGSEFLVEPWNPWGGVLAFGCFVLLITGFTAGHRWMLPWAVVVGSHCIQCHVGYLALVGALLAVSLAYRLRLDGRRLVKPAVVAAALGFLLWLPPVLDQLFRTRGNLRILYDHFRHPDAPAVGVGAALKGFAGEFNAGGGWLLGPGHLPTQSPNLLGFVAMVAVAGAALWVAARRRDRPVLELGAVVGLACVVGIVSMSRIFGEFYDYVVRWLWVLTGLAAGASAWALLRAWSERRGSDKEGGDSRRIGAVATGLVAAIGLLAAVQMADDPLPAERNSRLVGGLVEQSIDNIDEDGRYLVRWHDPASLGGVGFGVVLELERQGITVGVDEWGSAAALPHRVLPEGTATGVLWVVTGDPAIEGMAARSDAVLLGAFDQRSEDERVESDAIRARIEERLTEIGRADLIPALDSQYGLAAFVIGDAPVPQDVKVLAADYIELRLPGAIYLVPPGAPLYP